MDDKTFIAAFAAKELKRINESMKEMVNSPEPPSEEERQAIVRDIETTLQRLQSALSQITPEMLEGLDDEDEEPHGRPS